MSENIKIEGDFGSSLVYDNQEIRYVKMSEYERTL